MGSYIGGPMAMVYGWVWKWADMVSSPMMLTFVTMLVVAGIYMPEVKTVWETLVVYFVTQGAMGMAAQSVAKPAMMYYVWGEWDKWDDEAKEWCAKDANGECIKSAEKAYRLQQWPGHGLASDYDAGDTVQTHAQQP